MRWFLRGCGLTALLVAVVSLTGCGKATGIVEGKVTLDGKAIFKAIVRVESDDGKDAQTAETDTQGNYSISAAPAGTVHITVQPPQPFVFPKEMENFPGGMPKDMPIPKDMASKMPKNMGGPDMEQFAEKKKEMEALKKLMDDQMPLIAKFPEKYTAKSTAKIVEILGSGSRLTRNIEMNSATDGAPVSGAILKMGGPK